MAHTPGPWTFYMNQADYVEIHQARSGDEKYRGEVASCHSAEHIGGVSIDEMKANARLIAAAPDMKELLKDTLTELAEDSVIRHEILGLLMKVDGVL